MIYNKTSQNFEKGELIPISMAGDHWVLDGAYVARFFENWKQIVESP